MRAPLTTLALLLGCYLLGVHMGSTSEQKLACATIRAFGEHAVSQVESIERAYCGGVRR